MQVLLVVVVVLVAAAWLAPRFVANWLDYRGRFAVATAFERDNPQLPGESDEAYMERVRWHVLTTLGLPPPFVAKQWLRANKTAFLPGSSMIERYLRERAGKPLPDGRPDQRVTNGQGHELLALVRGVEPPRP